MSAPAAWLADPTGRHQLRYWNGSAWTDFVSDGGVQTNDPVAGGAPVQQSAWMDKVKSTAQQAAASASQAVDQGAAALSQQTQQWNQPATPATPAAAPATASAAAATAASDPAVAEALATPASSIADQLHKLADLRDRGVLTDEEFQTQKMRVING